MERKKETKMCIRDRTAEERKALLEQEHAQVSITSYDLLRRDIALYEEREFRFQILDEAQYLSLIHIFLNPRARVADLSAEDILKGVLKRTKSSDSGR